MEAMSLELQIMEQCNVDRCRAPLLPPNGIMALYKFCIIIIIIIGYYYYWLLLLVYSMHFLLEMVGCFYILCRIL